MKFSEAWLRQWVNPAITTEQLVAQLTMAGLEVDAVEPVAGEFSGVVVGHILEVESHPDAEKLRVCKVAGLTDGPAQVVCGAPNARVGIKVPFATIGAKLPGDFKIKKAKLRGVESFGMLCAQTELQAGEDDAGLWELPESAPVGEDLRNYLNLDDCAIEVDLTPNRGDCLSIRGLAREVGVLTSTDVTALEINAATPTIDDIFAVNVTAQHECPSYAGRIVKNVDVSRASPDWMVERLRRSGIRSIDAVVDVTNYVLLELGQPMHAFDLAKLNGGIEVRLSKKDETLVLLDEQKITLHEGSLVIADISGPVAIAGIMGGKATAVSATTKDVFLESAFFAPMALAGKARSYGLHTDSSHRFERGVDTQLQKLALERATELLLEITGGEPGPITFKRSEALDSPLKINLRKQRLSANLGANINDDLVEQILVRLGLELLDQSDSSWTLVVPSHRFDLEIEEDLIEEVARVYGYDNLPTKATSFSLALPAKSETKTDIGSIKSHMISRGLQEVITYSFIDPTLQAHFSGDLTPLALQNPISSEMSVMRTSLVPGLVSVLKTNLNRQKTRIQCFEEGLRFCSQQGKTADLVQERAFAALIYGPKSPVDRFGKPVDVDFYDIKGHLESLLEKVVPNKAVAFEPTNKVDYLHPGQAALVMCDGEEIGHIGALHPSTQKALELNKPAFVFELKVSPLLERPLPKFSSLSRFPEVSRDLAIVLASDVPFQTVKDVINSAAGNYLTNLKLFDVYRGEGIDPERKSLGFSLTFQHPSRTLKDDEINTAVASVVSRLEDDLDATLR